jgi:Type VI secretion system (T6SS), amidase effector protein 4
MLIINFQRLWNNHPLNQNPPVSHPCRVPVTNADAYPHECSIKMSVALMGAGVNMSLCPKTRCDYRRFAGHENHIIRAQELADWLASPTVLGTPQKYLQPKKQNLEEYKKSALWNVSGKTGIVFFQNFWGQGNQGDHLDVWNEQMMSGDFQGANINYFTRAPHIWFWEIK